MRTALLGVDVVCVRVDNLVIAVVILETNLDLVVFCLFVDVNRLWEKCISALVQGLDEFDNTAFIVEGFVTFPALALIDKGNGQAFV